jgi:hypothetical protein
MNSKESMRVRVGGTDLIHDYALPVPTPSIAEMMGVPVEEHLGHESPDLFTSSGPQGIRDG